MPELDGDEVVSIRSKVRGGCGHALPNAELSAQFQSALRFAVVADYSDAYTKAWQHAFQSALRFAVVADIAHLAFDGGSSFQSALRFAVVADPIL